MSLVSVDNGFVQGAQAAGPEAMVGPDGEVGGSLVVIMAGGGTGGHLYPGLAIAEKLRERFGRRLRLVWAATPRAIDRRLLSGYGGDYVAQEVQPVPRNIFKLPGFYGAWRRTCEQWRRFMQEQRVAAVVALGGYAAGPAAREAFRRGVPVVLINPDRLPGRANRFLLGRAQTVFSQWPMPEWRKRCRGQIIAAGCPIRESISHGQRAAAMVRLGLAADRQTLVITGASLGAKTINDAVLYMARHEPRLRAMLSNGGSGGNWQILHLTGLDQAAAVRKEVSELGLPHWHVLDYCDEMDLVWAAADLAIARSGAGLCAELTACGVPAILLPYPFHRDRHQEANARELVNGAAAVMLPDQKDAARTSALLAPALMDLMSNIAKRQRMRAAATAMAKPRAAAQISEAIVKLVSAGVEPAAK